MQIQSLKSTTFSTLKSKSTQNSTYRKALTIYQSIIQSSKQIPNFQVNYANNDNNFALFVFGSVFKLLNKSNNNVNTNNKEQYGYNIDGMLMIINMMLEYINIGAIRNNGILKQLQAIVYNIITNNQIQQKTPLIIRLAISILGYTLINSQKIQQDKQSVTIIQHIFNISVQSHRTNILSKQSSKMLIHVIKQNPYYSKILSNYATMSMLSNLQSNLHLNNIRQVIAEFPLQLINDICYRVSKHLSNIECTNEDQQTYLAQTYYFLQKLVTKLSISTLQQICKQLINNLPTSAKSQGKVIFCYIQTLHVIFENFVIMNQRMGYKYFSAVLSILQEYITKGGKVQKQAYGVLRSIMGTCVRKSLWINQNSQELQDILQIQGMGLEQTCGSNFSRVVCMLQGMLNSEYPNYKQTALVIQSFFSSLDKSVLPYIQNFIHKIIQFRNNFDDRSYKKVIQSIFASVSIQQICKLYPISVSGDIANQNYQQNNNLWLVYCTEKYDGQEEFNTFMVYYYPLLRELKNILVNNKNLSGIRVQAYKSLVEMIWRCLKVFCRKPNAHYNYQPIIQTIKKQIDEVNDSTLDHISMALQSLCNGLHKQQYQCGWSGNLISMLAKSLNLQKNNSKQILRAMKYLSTIADKQYLTRVFDKNIVKLLQEKQKQVLTHPEHISSNLKNLEILIAVSHGINFYDPTVVAPYKISRQELVIKLIEYLIGQNSLFQKKAYKYIFETLGLMGQSYLNQVIQLLESNQHKIMAASKHYRLAILMHLWTKLSKDEEKLNEAFEFMKKYLPQILMDMRQSNQRARRQAIAIFDAFCAKILQMELMESFVQIMCAGLAVDAVETKISTLDGLTQIFHRKYQLSLQFSIGILEIVLMLLYEQKSQIYKAVIDFSKRFIFFTEKTKQIQHILSTILQQLFKADLSSKMDNRSVLKHLLLKLTRKFGRENTQKYIPAEDRKILSNAIKVENRQKRKKRERLIKRRLQMEKARNQKDNSQQSDDQNQQNQQQVQQKMDIEGQQNQQLRQLQNTDNLLLKYDLQKQNFHFQQDKLHIKNKQKKQLKNKKQDDITFQGGMMVIRQDPRRKRQQKGQQQLNKQAEQEQPDARAFLNIKKKRKLNDIHEVKQSGATFRSDRAGGDVKLKDKPQPYAFIQFNSKALNKRFKKRAQKVFDTIFQRSQGGLKGIKSKIANRNH